MLEVFGTSKNSILLIICLAPFISFVHRYLDGQRFPSITEFSVTPLDWDNIPFL